MSILLYFSFCQVHNSITLWIPVKHTFCINACRFEWSEGESRNPHFSQKKERISPLAFGSVERTKENRNYSQIWNFQVTSDSVCHHLSLCWNTHHISGVFLFGFFGVNPCFFQSNCYNGSVFVIVLLCDEIEYKVRYMKDDCIRWKH